MTVSSNQKRGGNGTKPSGPAKGETVSKEAKYRSNSHGGAALDEDIRVSDLFLTFLKIGSSSFSLAMAAEFKHTIVSQRGWLTDEEFMEGLAMSQTLPGPTFVLLANYIGNKLKGVRGAAMSAIGFILPSFLMMCGLSWIYFRFNDVAVVHTLFLALGALVNALILNAVLIIGKSAIRNWWALLIVAYALTMTFLYNNVFIILIGAALLGIAIFKRTLLETKAVIAVNIDKKSLLIDLGKIIAFIVAFFLLISLNHTLFAMGASFFRIGLFVFGNGYTMMPLIQQEVVNVQGWLSTEQFLVGIALGQITPGPVTITAVFIGYALMGFAGSIVGIVSMYLPATLLVVMVSPVFKKIRNNPWIRSALMGLNAAFVGLMLYILIHSGRTALVDIPTVALAVSAFAAMRLTKINNIIIILGCAAIFLLIRLG